MPAGGHQYSLVGFSAEVDRRPLSFVKPLPTANVCSTCGVVPKAIALFPCGHFLCESCSRQCQRSGGFACPLDGDACAEKEVTWIEHPARSVVEKQVFCWNHTNGCDVVTAASDISKHFHLECVHHLACCPKCDAGILASNVCAHLESHCEASMESSAAAIQARKPATEGQESLNLPCCDASNTFQRILNTTLTAISSIESQLNEIRIGVTSTISDDSKTDDRQSLKILFQEALSEMDVQMTKQSFQLDELVQNVTANQQTFYNSFMEKNEELLQILSWVANSRRRHTEQVEQFAAFREAVFDWRRETKAQFDRLLMAIDLKCGRENNLLSSNNALRETLEENFHEAAREHTESPAQSVSTTSSVESSLAEDASYVFAGITFVMPAATMQTWAMNKYALLKERARKEAHAHRMSEPEYLRRYFVSVGINLIQRFDGVYASFIFQLHEGKNDNFLKWPFQLKLKFSIVHPQKPETQEYCGTPPFSFKGWDSKPSEVSNKPLFIVDKCFSCEELERLGFVEDDKLLLR